MKLEKQLVEEISNNYKFSLECTRRKKDARDFVVPVEEDTKGAVRQVKAALEKLN